MIWLVWRRQRAALLFALGLAALVAVVTGVGRYVAVGIGDGLGVLPCLRGVLTGVCGTETWYAYNNGLVTAINLTWLAMIALPTVAGIVAGAGLFGRELERGTHVFALSQSTSRLRWWATAMLVAGLPVALAVGSAGQVAEIALRPFGNQFYSSPLDPSPFLSSGLLPAAYTLLAFGVAAASGLVLRNALAAVAVAAVVQIVVLAVLSGVARDRYLPAETLVEPLIATGSALDPDARQVGFDYVDRRGATVRPEDVDYTLCNTEDAVYPDCLEATGITGTAIQYQPVSRYWPFQAIESGILLALLAGTLGAGLWGLRRRVQ